MNMQSLFVIFFCSLFLLFVALDPKQNIKGIEIHMNNEPVSNYIKSEPQFRVPGSDYTLVLVSSL